jgi:hypothetical protein
VSLKSGRKQLRHGPTLSPRGRAMRSGKHQIEFEQAHEAFSAKMNNLKERALGGSEKTTVTSGLAEGYLPRIVAFKPPTALRASGNTWAEQKVPESQS